MSERYTSKDGLLSSSDPTAVARWNTITAEHEADKASWTDILRAHGVKYAHPDDGWVKRELDGSGKASVSWYAQFNDHPEVGDLIALGRPPRWSEHYRSNHDHPSPEFRGDGKPESASEGYRICRVTEVVERRWSGILGIWCESFRFEDTGERMPARAPGFWQRLTARLNLGGAR